MADTIFSYSIGVAYITANIVLLEYPASAKSQRQRWQMPDESMVFTKYVCHTIFYLIAMMCRLQNFIQACFCFIGMNYSSVHSICAAMYKYGMYKEI